MGFPQWAWGRSPPFAITLHRSQGVAVGTALAGTATVRSALLLFVLVGCSAQLGPASGGADGKGDGNGTGPDAAVVSSPDAAPTDGSTVVADNACGVTATLGDLGNLTGVAGSALQQGSTTQRVGFVSAPTPMSAAQPAPDYLTVELWDNFGVFAGGAARTGTFQITGSETDYDTCGACVLVLANVANDTPSKLLLATSGSVTITSVATAAGQTLQLSLSNASFVEIAADANGAYASVAGSSCPSPISSVGLSDTI